MGTLQSSKGKDSYATYRSLNKAEHSKEASAKKLENKLAKRKEWRIRKYKNKTREEISGTTDKLFYKWGIPVEGRK